MVSPAAPTQIHPRAATLCGDAALSTALAPIRAHAVAAAAHSTSAGTEPIADTSS